MSTYLTMCWVECPLYDLCMFILRFINELCYINLSIYVREWMYYMLLYEFIVRDYSRCFLGFCGLKMKLLELNLEKLNMCQHRVCDKVGNYKNSNNDDNKGHHIVTTA